MDLGRLTEEARTVEPGPLPLTIRREVMAGKPSPTPSYHLERIKQPDIEEAPEKGGLANRGFRGLGPCVEGYGLHAAIVLQPHGHAMGITVDDPWNLRWV